MNIFKYQACKVVRSINILDFIPYKQFSSVSFHYNNYKNELDSPESQSRFYFPSLDTPYILSNDSNSFKKIRDSMLVYENFVPAAQEQSLLCEVEPKLKKLRY